MLLNRPPYIKSHLVRSIIKATRKGQALTPAQEAASEAIRLIDMIYHRDNSFKESYTEERLTNRQQTVAPQVDAYFAWVKQARNKICGSQKLTEASALESIPGTSSILFEEPLPVLFYTALWKAQRQTN